MRALAAALLVLGCGDGVGDGIDAAGVDAMVDAIMVDAIVVDAISVDAISVDAMPVDAFACNGAPERCDRRYDEVVYLTTHNAMSSAERRWGAPNQTHAVPRQLEDGARALMLDTYRGDDGAALLCHGFCALGSQPLADGLAEVADFLDRRPGEVVTIIFESYLDPDATAAAFAEAGLAGRALHQPRDAPWPTLGALLAAGTPLVVFTDDRAAPAAYPWLHYVWDHAFETDFQNETPAELDCAPNRGDPAHPLFVLNHFLTAPIALPRLATQVNADAEAHARECAAVHGRLPQFVTVDFYEIGDVAAAVERLNGGR